VADPQSRASGAKGSGGCATSGDGGARAPADGSGGHISWSINAFCVMIKAFS